MKLRSNRNLEQPLINPSTTSQKAKVVKDKAKASPKKASADKHTAQSRGTAAPKVEINTTTTGVNRSNIRDHPWRPCSPWKDKGKFEADVAQYEAQCKDGIDRWGYPARNWYRRFFTPKGEIFPPEGLLSYQSPTDPQERWANRERAYTESSYPPAPSEEPKFPENRKFRNTSVVESPDSPGPAFKVAQDIPTYEATTQTTAGTAVGPKVADSSPAHGWTPPAYHPWAPHAPFPGWTPPPGYPNPHSPGWLSPSQHPAWAGHRHHPASPGPVWNGPAPPIITTYSADGRSVCHSQSWNFDNTNSPSSNGASGSANVSMFPNGVIPQEARDAFAWMRTWNQGNW